MSNDHNFLKVQVGILCVVCLLYLVASVFNLHHTPESSSGRRFLSAVNTYPGGNALPPWAEDYLVDVTERPNPSSETAVFWHIPKSGGTTAKRLYECLGQTLANRLGADPRFGHHKDKEVVTFKPYSSAPGLTYINVDTTTREGIIRAAKLGLVASKKADIIFTMDVQFAVDHLFDAEHKGRIFALFRNPVDRIVSKFYYLQTATWERTYRPEWEGMDIIEWTTNHNLDENFLVKKIMGLRLDDPIDIGDLIIAKEIVRRRFIVGLMNDMDESIRRFNIVLGLDYANVRGQQCREEYFGSKDHRRLQDDAAGSAVNSNPHPKVLEGTPEYNLIAERNALDMILWNYILRLYEDQRELINSYAR